MPVCTRGGRPGARADGRLLHAHRGRPVRLRPDRRGQRAVGHLRDGRAAADGPRDCRLPRRLLDTETIRQIFLGGFDKLREAGVALLGGHTVRDPEIKFGYAVTGAVDPPGCSTNAGARAGDVLVLTKPLGTGIVGTAHQVRRAPAGAGRAAVHLDDNAERAGRRGTVAIPAATCTRHRHHRVRAGRPRHRDGRRERRRRRSSARAICRSSTASGLAPRNRSGGLASTGSTSGLEPGSTRPRPGARGHRLRPADLRGVCSCRSARHAAGERCAPRSQPPASTGALIGSAGHLPLFVRRAGIAERASTAGAIPYRRRSRSTECSNAQQFRGSPFSIVHFHSERPFSSPRAEPGGLAASRRPWYKLSFVRAVSGRSCGGPA